MPFIVGHPVQNPSGFYGRQRHISQLFEIIGSPQAQSVNILGLHHAGKTSFLRHIAHPAVMVRHLRHPENMVMVYADLTICKTSAHFYYLVQTQLRMKLGQVNTGLLWKDSPPDQMSIYDVEAFLCHFPNRRIILLVDEFDQVSSKPFGRNFLTELRAMASADDYDLTLVTASTSDLYLIGKQVGLPAASPFFNIFFPSAIYLAGLETAVIDTLIGQPAMQAGAPFSAEDVQTIKQLAGSLPYLLQVASARWSYHKRLGYFPDRDAVRKQLVAELSSCFSTWWASFDKCQRQLLAQLVMKQPLSHLPFSHFTIREAEYRLLQVGLVVKQGDCLDLNGAIIKDWIRQQLPDHLLGQTEKIIPPATAVSVSIPPA